jgi:hypothetical protein
MKTILSFAAVILFSINTSAQVLFGTFRNGNIENSVKLDISSATFSTVNNLNIVKGIAQGITGFDALNGRYFNVTEDEIKIIDAQTGLVIDSVINTPRLYNIEFDQGNNRLVGTRWNGSVMLFSSLDLTTKILTDIDTLTNTMGIAQGESAFDGTTNRYFNITDWRISIIDAQTGAILDSINNFTAGMKGIEFDPLNNRLIGTRWNGTNEVFTTLDLATNTFTSFGSLPGIQGVVQGESAFDVQNNTYFNITNLGIMVINANTGTIIDTISNTIQMKGIEIFTILENSAVVGPLFSTSGIQVYPNPAVNEAMISSEVKEKESTIFVTDLSGGKTYSIKSEGATTKFNMEHLPSGCYMVRDVNNNTTILVKP